MCPKLRQWPTNLHIAQCINKILFMRNRCFLQHFLPAAGRATDQDKVEHQLPEAGAGPAIDRKPRQDTSLPCGCMPDIRAVVARKRSVCVPAPCAMWSPYDATGVPWSVDFAVNQGWERLGQNPCAGFSVCHVQATTVAASRTSTGSEAAASAPAGTPVSDAAALVGPLPASPPAGERRLVIAAQTAQTPQQPQQAVTVAQACTLDTNMAQPGDPPPLRVLLAFAPPQGKSEWQYDTIVEPTPWDCQWFKQQHADALAWMSVLHCKTDWLVGFMDLSGSTVYDWKRYVASRPDAAKVIGEGITKFEFRYFYICGRPFRRGDLVAHRVDGTCVRLHPQSKGQVNPETNVHEEIPIYGRMRDWQEGPDDSWMSQGSESAS